jgi:hypothetical protein
LQPWLIFTPNQRAVDFHAGEFRLLRPALRPKDGALFRQEALRQPVERTSFPGLAPVSSPFSKIGVPEQIVMS